jgi:hypothetical protein
VKPIPAALIGFAALAFLYALLGNYVALPGYLRFLERGGTSAAGNTVDAAVIIGATKTILWMYAFNLGAMSLYLYTLLRHNPSWLGRGIALCIVWLAFWSVPSLPKMPGVFYVVVGSLILIAIVAVHVRTAHARSGARGFLFATSVLFFAMATWEVCGLGSTGRILHPGEVVLDRSQMLLSTQTTKLMIAMLIAWACLAGSRAAGTFSLGPGPSPAADGPATGADPARPSTR